MRIGVLTVSYETLWRAALSKLIGYAGVSTRDQSTDRQEADLLAAGVRCDDLYVDRGVSGARASRPAFDKALAALIGGDTLVITTLDRLGRSTQNMLSLATELRDRGAGLRVLNLGGGDVDTATPWARCSSPSWPPWLRWNTKSNANASPTPSKNAETLALTSAVGRAESRTARSVTPSASSTAANPPRKSPGISECRGPLYTAEPGPSRRKRSEDRIAPSTSQIISEANAATVSAAARRRSVQNEDDELAPRHWERNNKPRPYPKDPRVHRNTARLADRYARIKTRARYARAMSSLCRGSDDHAQRAH